jgi:hypothetical protein
MQVNRGHIAAEYSAESVMKKMKGVGAPKSRLAFLPTPKGREYFEQLGKRLTEERGLEVHVTQRETFDRMVEYAREGEAVFKARNGGSRRRRTTYGSS